MSLGEFSDMTVEDAIASAARKYGNRGKWGPEDHTGTANYVTPEKIRAAAALVRKGRAFSLAFPFDASGPQTGQFGRINPMHSMTLTGSDCASGSVPLPHGIGFADDHLYMPLQCGTQWDALSHAFDRNVMWNGYPCTEVSSFGARKCGVEHLADRLTSRGVLLDVPRMKGLDALPDGYAISESDLVRTIERQGPTAAVGRGDIVVLRTGQLGVRRTMGWGDFAGGPAPGLSFSTLGWLQRTEIAAVATDTWGVEVIPVEKDAGLFEVHQILLALNGIHILENMNTEELVKDQAWEFLFTLGPSRITGAVQAIINPIAIK